MGTGAYMTLQNNFCNNLYSSVSNVTCMKQNGDDGSHLEYFNAKLGRSQSVANVYIEADGSFFGGCSGTQSQFELTFVDLDNNTSVGSITLDLGSGSFNTAVVSNTAQREISVQIGKTGNGDQFTININVTAPSLPQVLANSAFWANSLAIQEALVLPPVTIPADLPIVGLTTLGFSAATFQGLDGLYCTGAAVSGEPSTGLTLQGTFTTDSLRTYTTLSVGGLTFADGFALTSPLISATVILNISDPSKASVRVQSVTLLSGGVESPDPMFPTYLLDGLMAIFKEIVNSHDTQQVILAVINKYLSR